MGLSSALKASILIYREEQLVSLYRAVTARFLDQIKQKPNSVILLPTGSTPEKMYAHMIREFARDHTLDLSQAFFFNLDEYVGLSAQHPLSYAYYMEQLFYAPLRRIDAKRAPQPERCWIPSASTLTEAQNVAVAYAQKLKKGVDLAILGVGSAYPVALADGTHLLQGGHLAFNEPGTLLSQSTRVVMLAEKTRLDTQFRFSSLRDSCVRGLFSQSLATEVPTHALSVGLAEILSAQQILVLAVGESKGPVIRQIFSGKSCEKQFPAQYLLQHECVTWFLDEFAAGQIQEQEPAPSNLSERLQAACKASVLPQRKRIVVLSPHPDDDVICMGVTLKQLQERGNQVHVIYAVSGANSVSDSMAVARRDQKFQGDSQKSLERLKADIRRDEAVAALELLGIGSECLHFFEATYYRRRGIPSLSPIELSEVQRMVVLLQKLQPEYVFYSAENDPHGAHGLAADLLAQAFRVMGAQTYPVFYGYRGAYNEWNLDPPESLLLIFFDAPQMDLKVQSIQAHVSQLSAMFPSFDARPFWQRARDRNEASAQRVQVFVSQGIQQYVEIFKRVSDRDFLRLGEGGNINTEER